MIPIACAVCPGVHESLKWCKEHHLRVTAKHKHPPCRITDWRDDRWWCQHTKGFGDLLVMTPALQAVARARGKRVGLWIADEGIRECFADAGFLELMDAPGDSYPALLDGGLPLNSWAKWSISEAQVKATLGPTAEVPPPYIDRGITAVLPRSNRVHYVGIAHGASNLVKGYIDQKGVPVQVRRAMIQEVLSAGMVPVLFGIHRDWHAFWYGTIQDLPIRNNYVGQTSCREAVSLIGQCDGWISNDTGLCHVAASLRVPGVALWKGTSDHLWRAAWPGIERCKASEPSWFKWVLGIRAFLQKLKKRKPGDFSDRFQPGEDDWWRTLQRPVVRYRRQID